MNKWWSKISETCSTNASNAMAQTFYTIVTLCLLLSSTPKTTQHSSNHQNERPRPAGACACATIHSKQQSKKRNEHYSDGVMALSSATWQSMTTLLNTQLSICVACVASITTDCSKGEEPVKCMLISPLYMPLNLWTDTTQKLIHGQTHGYLHSRTASPPFSRYQIILLGDAGTCVRNSYLKEEQLGHLIAVAITEWQHNSLRTNNVCNECKNRCVSRNVFLHSLTHPILVQANFYLYSS